MKMAATECQSRKLPVPVRIEQDSLGKVEVPADRYFGAETMRAIRNFPITGIPLARIPELITALMWIKKAAALTNFDAGDLDREESSAIVRVCDEVLEGKHRSEFCVDVIQGGAGTSTNMNANEVIANRALELLGYPRGTYRRLDPKNHVNKCQSTNDVYATAIRLTMVQTSTLLVNAVEKCAHAFEEKGHEFEHINKLGRTQLQDAVPMTAGAEIQAFGVTLREDVDRLIEIKPLFLEVNLGGTAIGTAVGASQYYLDHVMEKLEAASGMPVTRSANSIEASWDTGIFVLYSGLLKRLATKLCKISNDLRLLSSGPFGGLGELNLPKVQPGSSIMPGKVNPVIPEVMNQVCYRVFGADTTVTFASAAGQLQLNAMEPVIVWSLYEASTWLVAAIETFVDNCIVGISIDEKRCLHLLNNSTARVTMLTPYLGHGGAALIAKKMTTEGLKLEEALRRVFPKEAGMILGQIL